MVCADCGVVARLPDTSITLGFVALVLTSVTLITWPLSTGDAKVRSMVLSDVPVQATAVTARAAPATVTVKSAAWTEEQTTGARKDGGAGDDAGRPATAGEGGREVRVCVGGGGARGGSGWSDGPAS